MKELSTERIREHFANFVRYEKAVGGPDPQLPTVAAMSIGVSVEEMIWRSGCYCAGHNVPTAEVLWAEWPWPTILERPRQFGQWLERNWQGITTRLERRTVRTPANMNRFLIDYADFAVRMPQAAWMRGDIDPHEAYELAWSDCHQVKHLGRYIAIKLLEFLERYCQAPISAPDIRPRGAHSPRGALAMFYPEYAEPLGGDDRPGHLDLTNVLVEETEDWLYEAGVKGVSLFDLQVALCEFKSSIIGRHYYPGRSLDEELVYQRKIDAYWNDRSGALLAARAATFPVESLGEEQGWHSERKICDRMLADHDIVWSDLVYDFHATLDFSNPARRGES